MGNGKFYQGEIDPQTNKRDGFGRFLWPNGTSYVGLWKNDDKHGMGIESGKYHSKIQNKVCNSVYEGQ